MPEWLASPKMWGDIFVVGAPIAEKILRPALVYVFLVVALRVFGKRELDSCSLARGPGSWFGCRHPRPRVDACLSRGSRACGYCRARAFSQCG